MLLALRVIMPGLSVVASFARLKTFARVREYLQDLHVSSPVLMGFAKLFSISLIMLNVLGGAW